MKLLIFLFLLILFSGLSPQLRTRYQARPAITRVRRKVVYVGRRRVWFAGYCEVVR